jgi:hypothetical protein
VKDIEPEVIKVGKHDETSTKEFSHSWRLDKQIGNRILHEEGH